MSIPLDCVVFFLKNFQFWEHLVRKSHGRVHMIIQTTILAAKSNFNSVLKNPVYERQRISQPMRRVAPILLLFFAAAAKGASRIFFFSSFGDKKCGQTNLFVKEKNIGETNLRQQCFFAIFCL